MYLKNKEIFKVKQTSSEMVKRNKKKWNIAIEDNFCVVNIEINKYLK